MCIIWMANVQIAVSCTMWSGWRNSWGKELIQWGSHALIVQRKSLLSPILTKDHPKYTPNLSRPSNLRYQPKPCEKRKRKTQWKKNTKIIRSRMTIQINPKSIRRACIPSHQYLSPKLLLTLLTNLNRSKLSCRHSSLMRSKTIKTRPPLRTTKPMLSIIRMRRFNPQMLERSRANRYPSLLQLKMKSKRESKKSLYP